MKLYYFLVLLCFTTTMKLTKNTKVFITGCGGMLGEAVFDLLKNQVKILATDKDVNDSFLSYCDIRDSRHLSKMIKEFNPDIIFHLAALTDLEYCERHRLEAYEVNAKATEYIASICRDLKIPMVYISTAGIFDGKKEFYIDDDGPNPINVYGKTKYEGERAVQRICPKHFIFRAGWMMGGGPKKDKKFVNKIMKQINAGSKVLNVVDDKLGTPTYTFDFVKNILTVVGRDLYGLYNLVCRGSGSRFDVAKEIVKNLKKSDIKINKVKSDFFKKEYFAKRPRSEKLVPFKLKKMKLYTMRDWKICLKEYLPTFH